jgi:small-conductance mechanosensitive channel
MTEISNDSQPIRLLLKLFIFILGSIFAFATFFIAYEYKFDNSNPYDPSYGATTPTTDGLSVCVTINPSVECYKTIDQAYDQVRKEGRLFASVAVLIELFIISTLIWLIFRNTRKTILSAFILGSLFGLIIVIVLVFVYHFPENFSVGYNP